MTRRSFCRRARCAPAATCDAQIDIVTRNAQPGQITPLGLTRYDASGKVVSTDAAKGLVRPMPVDARTYADGSLAKPAGDRSTPAAGHESPQKKADGPIDRLRQGATGAQQGYTRASSARYGAAGGAAATLIDDCREIFGCEPAFVSEIGPVIGAHAGPGLLGVGSVSTAVLS